MKDDEPISCPRGVCNCSRCSIEVFALRFRIPVGPLVARRGQVGEMLKDREGVIHGGMTGKGLKVR